MSATHDARPVAATLPASFNRLAWSNLAAQSAEQIALAATPIVAVIAFGAGVGETGLLQTLQTLPFVLFAIPLGLAVDRMSRAHLMAAAEALRAVSLVIIVLLIAAGALTLPMLALLGFVGACGTVAFSIAAPALVPSLVPAAALAAANARLEIARTVAFLAGPALAGALVGWASGTLAFAIAATLSVVAASLLARLQDQRPPAPATSPGVSRLRKSLTDIRDGLAFVFSHALLRPIFVTQFIFNAAFFMLQAAYAPYAIRHLGLSATQVGLTLAAYGAGMLGGALAAARITRVAPFGAVIGLGPVVGLAAAVLMALTIWTPSFTLAALSFFLMGAGPIVWVISTTTLRQTVTPPYLLGRVSAINILGYGSRPLGAALGALVGASYGAEACIVAAACGFALQAAVILWSPAVRLTHQPAMQAQAC